METDSIAPQMAADATSTRDNRLFENAPHRADKLGLAAGGCSVEQNTPSRGFCLSLVSFELQRSPVNIVPARRVRVTSRATGGAIKHRGGFHVTRRQNIRQRLHGDGTICDLLVPLLVRLRGDLRRTVT